jgi:predicted ATPase/DNA-binding CsgD family transcriptional regulator
MAAPSSQRRAANNLPADLTSFVARRPEAVQIRQLLTTSRLVTLVGVGGVGKTRLAVHVARDVQRAFPDGVFLVELAALTDPALLPHTVIDALAIPEQSSRAPMNILADYLRRRQILLVFDNCEHLLESAAEITAALLRSTPGLRILATSRQALGVPGEHIMPVPALPVPAPDVPLVPGFATQYAALALFAERAAAVVPGFAITAENEAAVLRLCQRLEGIPLAIELAAVRLRVLAVADLVTRLDRRFQLLTQGSRTAPERHQTLRAAIDWSFDLCTPAEQLLWARASVFAASFDLEAVEAICTDGMPPEAILDTVAGLTDKSIFIREEHAGHVRFRMLETIREYGQARLRESGTESALKQRHRDWYVRLVEQASAEWFGPKQERWSTRLLLEHANLRTALEFCLAQPGQVRIGLHLAGIPWFLWVACGFLTEGRYWLDRALSLDNDPSAERAWALGSDGYIAVLQGDLEAGGAILEQCRSLALELDDPATLAYATHLLGLYAMFKDDLVRAVELFLEGLARYEATDVTHDYPNGLRMQLATTYLLQNDVDQAFDVVRDVHRRCEQCGERWLLSYAIWGLGFVALARGQLEQADVHLRDSLRIKRFFHDTLGLALALDVLAWTTAARGEGERAAVLLGGASQLWRTFGAQLFGSKHLMTRREQFEEQARQILGDHAFDAAFARGSDLTVDETLTYALQERVSTAPAQSRRAATELTRREREIADLVADGMSNKEIASTLVISFRTAEGHVEHILTKLGFTSRAQIAAWVTGQRARTSA